MAIKLYSISDSFLLYLRPILPVIPPAFSVEQMLSAYARRGLGMTILRNTLAEPLQKICAQRALNLEINPLKVYQEHVADVETRTGQRCDLPACETAEQAARLPAVADICARRLVQLLDCCRTLLTRIVDGVESIPYGFSLRHSLWIHIHFAHDLDETRNMLC
jgi:hypothetical protein